MNYIYSIKNLVSGRIYIGSTFRHYQKRWSQHEYELDTKRHGNPHLQAAWDKYGSTSFAWSVVEEVPDRRELIAREQYWINFYKTGDVYNIATNLIPGSGRRVKRSLEVREKISIAKLKNPMTADGRARRRKTYFKLYGKAAKMRSPVTGEVFDVENKAEFAERFFLDTKSLGQVILGKAKSHRGWKLVTDDQETKQIQKPTRAHKPRRSIMCARRLRSWGV